MASAISSPSTPAWCCFRGRFVYGMHFTTNRLHRCLRLFPSHSECSLLHLHVGVLRMQTATTSSTAAPMWARSRPARRRCLRTFALTWTRCWPSRSPQTSCASPLTGWRLEQRWVPASGTWTVPIQAVAAQPGGAAGHHAADNNNEQCGTMHDCKGKASDESCVRI